VTTKPTVDTPTGAKRSVGMPMTTRMSTSSPGMMETKNATPITRPTPSPM